MLQWKQRRPHAAFHFSSVRLRQHWKERTGHKYRFTQAEPCALAPLPQHLAIDDVGSTSEPCWVIHSDCRAAATPTTTTADGASEASGEIQGTPQAAAIERNNMLGLGLASPTIPEAGQGGPQLPHRAAWSEVPNSPIDTRPLSWRRSLGPPVNNVVQVQQGECA